MAFYAKIRVRPDLESLDHRTLLTAVTASLFHSVLTVTRTDATQALVIDVQFLSIKAHRKVEGARGGGSVLVEGVGRFAARKVRSISINPGRNADKIVVHEPSRKRIPYHINRTNLVPTPIAPPPAPTIPSVPGVTGTLSSFEQQIFDLVNVERVKAGVAPLAVNAKLVTAAQIQARNMAATGVMSHDLSGQPGIAQPTLTSRAQFVAYSYGWLGENIASYFVDAPSLVAGWMGSPHHRETLLDPNLTEAGIGVGVDSKGSLFFCQEFGSPAQG